MPDPASNARWVCLAQINVISYAAPYCEVYWNWGRYFFYQLCKQAIFFAFFLIEFNCSVWEDTAYAIISHIDCMPGNFQENMHFMLVLDMVIGLRLLYCQAFLIHCDSHVVILLWLYACNYALGTYVKLVAFYILLFLRVGTYVK